MCKIESMARHIQNDGVTFEDKIMGMSANLTMKVKRDSAHPETLTY